MAATSPSGGPRGFGGFRFTWRGAAVVNALENAVQDAMDETAAVAKAAAQDLCPVDTGLLRSSIFADVDVRGGAHRRTLVLGANAPYAVYVILGTDRQRAQDFIRPVMDQEAPKLTQRIRAALGSGR